MTALTKLIAAALIVSPLSAFAAGSSTATPPTPSETTTTCAEGLVFDLATQTCLPPEQSTNDSNAMYEIMRELAYDGRYADAKAVLDLLDDQSDVAVLTYQGFLARKMGDVDAGMAFYAAALTTDPTWHAARSYRGQAYVEQGDLVAARADLAEIRRLGGRGTWPEISLRMAIENGRGFRY